MTALPTLTPLVDDRSINWWFIIPLAVIVVISISGHSYLQKHFIEESWFGTLGNKHLPGLYEAYIKQHIDQAPTKPGVTPAEDASDA